MVKQETSDGLPPDEIIRRIEKALAHGGIANEARVNVSWVDAEQVERAFGEARKAYLALGDEVASDQLVALRYKSILQDGKLLYGVVAVETATCKKGDQRVTLHAAPVPHPGQRPPPQSSAVSLPFFTPSPQAGAAHSPSRHTPEAQSAPEAQPSP